MVHKNDMTFIRALAEDAERETVDYIMKGMKKFFGEYYLD